MSHAFNTGAAPPFADNFNEGASPLWGNEVGSWSASGGVYNAAAPGNFPNAHSLLAFDLTDFELEVDVNDLVDGGVWLRASSTPGVGVGVNGVLLVTKGSGVYWHVVPAGGGYGTSINPANGLFPPGSDVHLRCVVRCNVYSVYVNGDTAPATFVETGLFSHGRAGLYDFSGQTFDNVLLTEPFEPCVADLSGDCIVDGADLALILGNWGGSGATDLTGDGTTDGADLAVVLGFWGPC